MTISINHPLTAIPLQFVILTNPHTRTKLKSQRMGNSEAFVHNKGEWSTMSRQVRVTKADLRVLFEQYWLHWRHIESERAWFMSVYAAITGGILTYIFKTQSAGWQPLVFLLVLTIVGLSINYRWAQVFEHHRKLIKSTASALGMTAEVDVPYKCRLLRTRILFPLFYCIILVILLYLLVDI